MKTGLSLQELAGEITRRADKKEDLIADTRTLRLRSRDRQPGAQR